MDVRAAPLDRATRVVTAVASAVLVIGGVGPALFPGPDMPVGVRVAFPALLVGCLAAAWAFAPAGYELHPGALVVRRRGVGAKRYAVSGEPEPAPCDARGMRGIRLMGSGGLFGWHGLFWSRALGRYHAHVTDRSRMLLVASTTSPVLVSPADRDTFLAAWRTAAGSDGGASGR